MNKFLLVSIILAAVVAVPQVRTSDSCDCEIYANNLNEAPEDCDCSELLE